MVIEKSGKKIVAGGDGMGIAGEMQVDFLHRNNLRATAACTSAFDSEHRSQ